MKKTSKIGWQKYEDVIEEQLNSPIIDQLYSAMLGKTEEELIQNLTEEEYEQMQGLLEEQGIAELPQEQTMINIPEALANEISLATNFDCWIGHTNFNLTEQLKNKLDQIEGVEMLKIYSRYRFLVGVGRMFEFSDVRKDIEGLLNDYKE